MEARLHRMEVCVPQTFGGEALRQLNAHSVADAVRWMSGVALKDYGGIGGLKTVNLRSMGSHHVGIYYDGLEMGNAQNGVVDLGQLSLDNVEQVSVYHGQRASMLQTAHEYASSGTVYIETSNPWTQGRQVKETRLKLRQGSCDTWQASALVMRRLGQQTWLNVNAEGLTTSGRYPFSYRRRAADGTLAYDTTAIRENGDVRSMRLEANAYGHDDRQDWQAKAYYMTTRRGIPGAIVNNVWRRGERQDDRTLLLQAQLRWLSGNGRTTRLQAKYASYHTHYINKDTTQLMIDDRYHQQQLVMTAATMQTLGEHWSDSWSVDLEADLLTSDRPTLPFNPLRLRADAAKAVGYDDGRLRAQASVAWTGSTDRTWHVTARTSRQSLYAAALTTHYDLGNSWALNAMAKRGYRLPTLNDLYYADMGNADLRPEVTTQLSAGCTWSTTLDGDRIGLQMAADAYHNRVRDKIVAYPKGQQFRWTMLNLGRVHINGLELRASGKWQPTDDWLLEARLQYTYQQARDVTDRNTSYYGHQIPYVPWHSGGITGNITWKALTIGYNWTYTGERYSQQENIAYNHLQPWYTSDMTISYHHGPWRVSAALLNVLNQAYDVIENYPMPGRNYNVSLQWNI